MAKLTEAQLRIRGQAATGFLHARTGANNPYRVSISEIESYRGRRDVPGGAPCQAQVLLRTKSGEEIGLVLAVEELDELMREWSKPRLIPGEMVRQRPSLGLLHVTAENVDADSYPARINVFQIESYRKVTNRDRLVKVRTKTGEDHWVHGTVEGLDKDIEDWWRQL